MTAARRKARINACLSERSGLAGFHVGLEGGPWTVLLGCCCHIVIPPTKLRTRDAECMEDKSFSGDATAACRNESCG